MGSAKAGAIPGAGSSCSSETGTVVDSSNQINVAVLFDSKYVDAARVTDYELSVGFVIIRVYFRNEVRVGLV